jgi:hypothetical protein
MKNDDNEKIGLLCWIEVLMIACLFCIGLWTVYRYVYIWFSQY